MINMGDRRRDLRLRKRIRERRNVSIRAKEKRLNVNRCAKATRVGKWWLTFTRNGMLQGSDLPPFSVNAAVGFWLCLPTYQPTYLPTKIDCQISPSISSAERVRSPGVSVSDSRSTRSRDIVNSRRRPLVLPFS